MVSQHVLVAGGGIVGCLTAMELVARGCQVTIVERNVIASQTSGESSWAGAGIVFPLLPWMYSEHVNRLTSYGAASYGAICQRLLNETGIDPQLIVSGFLLLPEFDRAAALAWCEQNQLPAQAVHASAFGVQSLSGEEALWLPTVSQIRPPCLMHALRAWLEQNNVRLLEHTELEPLREIAELREWRTTSGEMLQADQFIVTSGAWSFDLLKQVASKLQVKPMRGQIVLYKPERQLQQVVYREGFYLVPRRDGYLLAGSTLEDVGFDASVTSTVREEICAKAEAIMPDLKGLPVIKHWSGLRPGTPDNLPVIAPHPQVQNLYLNTGHFRYGLTMAPASARLVAAMVCGETPWTDAAPFALPG
ncbi:FAD-dependent oxidoreductase [Methylobacillus gramineus]|uniref:NAD(P)/FAD-dependent oxidoreductase n=1 Tax=Methylobacillus gramineus TaxID=755169 RepID=UPI001CFFDD8D|nr:FAD-dependent oxidoreductase [Methylobacillus gramineus]MCB5185575.1 FAD-dependent oxidoreductase [Methylobacillus gramineus]